MSVKKKVSTTEVKHSSSSLNGSNMIGFIGAVLILINAVVGIGIYFKNSRVFSANNNNFLGIMFSWIIGFVIMLCVIAIISQVLTAKTKTPLKDMGDWQRTFTGRHIGLFFKIYLPLVYFTFMYFVLAFFAAEALAFVGGFEGEHIIFIFLIAFGLLLVTSIGYIVAEKFSINFSKIGPFIKFVPFLMLIVVAIIVAIVSPSKTYFSGTHEGFEVGSFSVTGILSTLPSVLFAFDGFMIIASISHKIKNSEKNMPWIYSIGILTIGVLYLLITVFQFLAGAPTILNTFDNIFPDKKILCMRLVAIFLFIAALCSTNAFAFATVDSLETLVDNNLLVFSTNIRHITKCKKNMSGFLVLWSMIVFYFALFGVVSIFLNTDTIIDLASNCVVFILFIGFGVLSAAVLFNHFRKEENRIQTKKTWYGIIVAIVATLCTLAAVGYVSFYTYLYRAIDTPNDRAGELGLFADGKGAMHLNRMYAAVAYWTIIVVFVAIPVINNICKDKRFNSYLLRRDKEIIAQEKETAAESKREKKAATAA